MTDFIANKSLLDSSFGTPLAQSVGTSMVAIMLCTFNGERFLTEQLVSLEAQTYQNWVLIVSDDGSKDSTLDILLKFQAKWPDGKMIIRNGPKKGFCQNFLSLVCDPRIQASYFAFCDQDDVWLPEKLNVALQKIAMNQDSNVPFLYCGRTTYVTSDLKPLELSPLFSLSPSFRNALVQSIAGGNTMVFNLASKLLIEKAGSQKVPSHDWWVYLLISGVQGNIFYDSVPYLLYRQHDDSLVGGGNSLSAKVRRVVILCQGRLREWNAENIAALKAVKHLLTKNSQDTLDIFEKLRYASLIYRLRLMKMCGLYRQTCGGSFSLILAVLLKKL